MLLKKVLWEKKGKKQIIGASLGVLVGLFLLLLSIQFYIDTNILMRGAKDSNLIVVNKTMSILNTLGADNSFTAEEIEELKAQPFIKSLGTFESNRFRAALESSSMGFYTLIFLQTVPKEYIGINTNKFKWKQGDKVPIVIASDYLSLYNYGFAPSQGLPQFTISTINKLTGELTLTGKGKTQTFPTYIMDVSPNINSILVPQEFMDYANATFGDKPNQGITQLVIDTDNPYSKALSTYLESKGYEVSRGGLIGGELKTVLDIVVLFLSAIAIIIIGLSLLVFILNFQLIVAQSSIDIQYLIQQGYDVQSITKVLANMLIRLFAIVLAFAFLLLIPVKYFTSQALIAQGYAQISTFVHPMVWILGLAFAALFIIINWRSILQNVRQLA